KHMQLEYRDNRLFCNVCPKYSLHLHGNKSSFVTTGCSDWWHASQRVAEHEDSNIHQDCEEAHLFDLSKKNVLSHVDTPMRQKRKKDIQERHQVVDHVIAVVKLLGKLNLPSRGHRNKAACETDNDVNHGIFLELLKILSKFNATLAKHLYTVIQKSQHHHESGKKGKGGLITFISKSTHDKIYLIIKDMIQQSAAREVQEAGIFSLQVNTTQDITAVDHCAVIVHYVLNGRVHERLLSILPSLSGNGQGPFDLVKDVLECHGIGITKCVSYSTDGAAACQAKFAGMAPVHVHIWCFTHSLNLVVVDATKLCVSAFSLFDILQKVAVLFKATHKRMDIWTVQLVDKVGSKKLTKLKLIRETRWAGKSTALSTIFGSLADGQHGIAVSMIQVWHYPNHDQSTKTYACSLIEAFLEYETILTAHIYMHIFTQITPLSDYFKTSGLDVAIAWRMVSNVLEWMKQYRQNFDHVVAATNSFVAEANKALELLPQLIRHRKCMPGELTHDKDWECVSVDPSAKHKVETFNVIVDQVVASLEKRFGDHGKLYGVVKCLHPRTFSEIVESGLPAMALDAFQQFLPRKNLDADTPSLRTTVCNRDKKCRQRFTCAFEILKQCRLHMKTYDLLHTAYKFVLTLSLTQVHCEQTFSKLKLIKTRRRSYLTAENLEAQMLLSVESSTAAFLSSEEILNKFAATSSELIRL
uniref:HAT C-terminal dimerisation domain-containing protein n=1 Tax=Latimeria chalumnae TaxID=7897 RepID=H2ZZG6_LATCH